ncbi:hypothetical protein JYK22_30980, partial [Nonomuraea sp. RK-328]|nr:hypothetical protein [Nonomuraea sp. RK-328]
MPLGNLSSTPWLLLASLVVADENLYGDFPAEVGSGTVPDSGRRSQIGIDVAVLAVQEPGRPRRILSLGEAKWGEVMGRAHLERLERARELLQGKGYDTRDTVLACYGGSGFTQDLSAAAETDPRILLVGLERLYGHA